MSTEETDDVKPEPTFTRAQMAREVNRQVKAKLAEALEPYADYAELQAKAAEADKSKSQLDRIEQQLADQVKRTEAAERETLVRSVAEELGIPLRLAKRLEGTTRAEMLADGRETMEDLGIKPKGKTTSTEPAAADGDVEDDGDGDQEQQQEQPQDAPPVREQPRRSSRPREQLQTAAPRTPTVPDETDPLKLAALIPRR